MSDKRGLLSKGMALFAGAIGIAILWIIWSSLIKVRFESLETLFFFILLLCVFVVPVTGVAVYFLYTAKMLWSGLSYKGICRFCVFLSILFAVILLSILGLIWSSSEEVPLWMEISSPILLLIPGLFYRSAKRRLLKWLSIPPQEDIVAHNRAVKLYFGFLGFFVFGAAASMERLLPRDPVYDYRSNSTLLEGVIYLGSILLGIWVYKIGVKWFSKSPLLNEACVNDECHE